jgi:hypothetical protein
MNEIFRVVIAAVTVLFLSLVPGCSNLGGSEIPNGVSAPGDNIQLHGSTALRGTTRSGVIATAFRTDYMPLWAYNAPPISTVSDVNGAFSLSLPKGATYNLVLTDTVTNHGAFVQNIGGNTEPIELGTIPLDSLGAITGKISGDTTKPTTYNIFVYGSPFFAKVNGNNGFLIAGLPPKPYDLAVTVYKSDAIMIVARPTVIGSVRVIVSAGITAKVDIGL